MKKEPMRSMAPYLLRAMHEWMEDGGFTPEIIIESTHDGVEVPAGIGNDGKVVLNLSSTACHNLVIGNSVITMQTRFNARAYAVRVPVEAVVGIRTRESGQWMELIHGPQVGETTNGVQREKAQKRPALKLVK